VRRRKSFSQRREGKNAKGAKMSENEVARLAVDAAFKVHTKVGPGVYESVYEAAMIYELERRELRFTRQQPIHVIYEGMDLGEGFRADIVVEDRVILELKSIEEIASVHKKQLLTYLRLSGKHLGLLINFNVDLLKDGYHRVVDNLT
jgi:GxxExxY protein